MVSEVLSVMVASALHPNCRLSDGRNIALGGLSERCQQMHRRYQHRGGGTREGIEVIAKSVAALPGGGVKSGRPQGEPESVSRGAG